MKDLSPVSNLSSNGIILIQDGGYILSNHYITLQKIAEKWHFIAQLRSLNLSKSTTPD